MTDINTTLTQTQAALAAIQQTAAAAAAGGTAQTQTADAAWRAVADLDAARAQADGLRGQLVARDAKLTQALTARAAALAKAELERTAGSKPLADATANALAAAVAIAAGTTAAKLTTDALPAVKKVDDDIAKLDDTAESELAAAEADLLVKQAAYDAKQAAADAALAAAEAAPVDLPQTLARALLRREEAAGWAKAGAATPPARGVAAAVAYADYEAARKALNDAKAASAETKLTTDWNIARDLALSALADLLAARTLASQRRLNLAIKRADIAAKVATRDADAAAAVIAALNPPPPPGP